MAAVSYDSAAILQDFTQRHKIDYPLLADPKSELIRQFGVLNGQATGFTRGMAIPGYFYITPDGVIKEKFFETAYTDRYTGNNLLMKLFPNTPRISKPEKSLLWEEVAFRVASGTYKRNAHATIGSILRYSEDDSWPEVLVLYQKLPQRRN